MKKQIKQLEMFQKAFNSTFNDKPTLLTPQEHKLRYDLSLEELNEYRDACEDGDLVEILDAITDRIFLAIGDAVSHGLQDKLVQAFEEVYQSNMTKLDENGKPIINGENGVLDHTRPIGKLLKSNNYKKPNLKQFF